MSLPVLLSCGTVGFLTNLSSAFFFNYLTLSSAMRHAGGFSAMRRKWRARLSRATESQRWPPRQTTREQLAESAPADDGAGMTKSSAQNSQF